MKGRISKLKERLHIVSEDEKVKKREREKFIVKRERTEGICEVINIIMIQFLYNVQFLLL